MEVESRSNPLQHRSGFLGYGRNQAKNNNQNKVVIRRSARPNSTRLCAPGIRQQHPGHNLIGHPLPQPNQYGLVPLARRCLQNVRLDMLIAHACNERLVSIRKPKELKRRPQLRVLHGHGDTRRRALREECERRGKELFEPAREGRGQDGEEMRLEMHDVGGRDGVA
jgi:hypothetical protein